MTGEIRSPLLCPKKRPAVILSIFQTLLWAFKVARQNEGRNRIGEQIVKHLGSARFTHFHDVRQLCLAHDLNAAGIKIIKQPENLQIRPVDIGRLYPVRVIGITLI